MLRLITLLTILSVTTACAPANIACNRSQLAFDPTVRYEDYCTPDFDKSNNRVNVIPIDNNDNYDDHSSDHNNDHSNDYDDDNYDDHSSDHNNDHDDE